MAAIDPLDGKLITLFGGAGFIGTYVAEKLLERGARLRIASRHPEQAFKLKPLAKLGQLQFVRADITRPRSVAICLEGADMAVNLVGTFKGDLMGVMGEGAGNVARAAAEAECAAHIYVSAIAADPQSEAGYARAKAEGERQAFEAFPNTTVLRPSLLFGQDDEFVNMFAGLIAKMPALPVFAPDAELQMVFVDDVAKAVVEALADPAKHGGKTFELGGPEAVTMMEFNRRIAAAQGRERSFIPLPDFASAAFAAIPGTPMGKDQWNLLQGGNVASKDMPGFKQLGIVPRPLGLYLDEWMVPYRKQGRFSTPVTGRT